MDSIVAATFFVGAVLVCAAVWWIFNGDDNDI